MSHLKDETSYMSPALCKRRFFVWTAFTILLPSPSTNYRLTSKSMCLSVDIL